MLKIDTTPRVDKGPYYKAQDLMDPYGSLSPAYREKVAAFIASGLKLVGFGTRRAVFLSKSGKFIYKVPMNQTGVDDNENEHKLYRNPGEYKYLTHEMMARCRLSPGGILVMELVKPVHECARMPPNTGDAEEARQRPEEWKHKWIDGFQVGVNREGRWVAFDYACEG